MNVNVTGPYIHFTIPIFGGIPITQTTISSCIITVILVIVAVRLGKQLKMRPSGKQVLVEKGVSMMYNMVVDTMGAHNAHWTPFIITIFLSSICGSLIGMTGFLRSTTADLSTTLTWSIMVSIVIWYNSIKNNGFLGWLKGFTEPVVVMTPMNIISEIAQPVSMAFRHFGNVAGGGVITSILYTALAGLSTAVLNIMATSTLSITVTLLLIGASVIGLGIQKRKFIFKFLGTASVLLGFIGLLHNVGLVIDTPIFQVGIPAVLSLYFDVFSGFVQALVFSLLTMVYIAGSCPPPEEVAES